MDNCVLLIENLRGLQLESQGQASEEPEDEFLDTSPFSQNYKQPAAQIEPPKQETGARPKTLMTEKPAEAAQLFPTRSPPDIPHVSSPILPPLLPRNSAVLKENPHLKRDAELRQSLGATALPNPGLPYPNFVTDEMVRQAVLTYQAAHPKDSGQPQLDALGNDPKFENVPLEDLTPEK